MGGATVTAQATEIQSLKPSTGVNLSDSTSGMRQASLRSGHLKARCEVPSVYPKRAPVPDEKQFWNVSFPDYHPVELDSAGIRGVVPKRVSEHDNLSIEDFRSLRDQGRISSVEDVVALDAVTGRPLNVRGRTGLANRGLLWQWGANFATDSLVVRYNRDQRCFEMVIIQRDNGEWAIPGGFVEPGEHISKAVVREFQEESGGGRAVIDFMQKGSGVLLYAGYVDDPRNTDNAWIETFAWLHILPDEIGAQVTLTAGDDAKEVRWLPLTGEGLSTPLFANHNDFVELAVQNLKGRGLIQ